MKILHINDTYRFLGGAEKYLLDTCNALEELGHSIVIISSSEREHITVPARKEYFVRPSYGLRSALKIWDSYKEIIEKEDPDAIHLHNTHYFVSPLIIRRLCKLLPVVKFVHDARFFCPSLGRKVIPSSDKICSYPVGIRCFNRAGCYPFHRKECGVLSNLHKFFFVYYELRVSRMLDKVIVGSRYMRDELLRNGFSEGKIKVMPCYTDMAHDISQHYAYDRKGPVLCVGRFDGIKGIPQFIEALNHLKDKQWEAEIVGDGTFIKESDERVKALGLGKRIKFLGRLSSHEIEECYRRCSMVVMPSMVPESFGLVGIEAMAFCKPVVAFNSGGIKEWLEDGKIGFLVERGDVVGLAGRVSQLLENESLAWDMGKHGREQVEKYYRKDIHLKQLLASYREAIDGRNKIRAVQ